MKFYNYVYDSTWQRWERKCVHWNRISRFDVQPLAFGTTNPRLVQILRCSPSTRSKSPTTTYTTVIYIKKDTHKNVFLQTGIPHRPIAASTDKLVSWRMFQTLEPVSFFFFCFAIAFDSKHGDPSRSRPGTRLWEKSLT